jgi:hypothetical protein
MRSVPGAVATGFIVLANSTVAWIETRSLPLPVLTTSSRVDTLNANSSFEPEFVQDQPGNDAEDCRRIYRRQKRHQH